MSKSQRLRKRFDTDRNYRIVRLDNIVRKANRMFNRAAAIASQNLGAWQYDPSVKHRSARLTMLKQAQAKELGAYLY